MKNMVKLGLAVVVLIGCTSVSFAQEKGKIPKTAEEKSRDLTQKMTKELDLNKLQQKKVKEIAFRNAIKKEKLQNQMIDLKRQERELTKKGREEMKVVLTDRQIEKWKELKVVNTQKKKPINKEHVKK